VARGACRVVRVTWRVCVRSVRLRLRERAQTYRGAAVTDLRALSVRAWVARGWRVGGARHVRGGRGVCARPVHVRLREQAQMCRGAAVAGAGQAQTHRPSAVTDPKALSADARAARAVGGRLARARGAARVRGARRVCARSVRLRLRERAQAYRGPQSPTRGRSRCARGWRVGGAWVALGTCAAGGACAPARYMCAGASRRTCTGGPQSPARAGAHVPAGRSRRRERVQTYGGAGGGGRWGELGRAGLGAVGGREQDGGDGRCAREVLPRDP
jgi:hypothetical protein